MPDHVPELSSVEARKRALHGYKSAFVVSRSDAAGVDVGVLDVHFFGVLQRLGKRLMLVQHHAVVFEGQDVAVAVQLAEHGLLGRKQGAHVVLSHGHAL